MPTITNAATVGGSGTFYNDAELDFSTYKFGTAAIKFDGSLKSYVKSSQSVSLGSQDWCLEMWLNLAAAQPNASARLAQVSPDLPNEFGPGHVSLRAAGGLALVVYDYSSSTPLISTSENLLGAGWKHVAVSREGSAWRLFVDGALVGSATWAGAVTGTNPLLLGGNSYSATGMSGHLDDIRLTVGAARYTAAFTAPTASFANYVSQSDPYFSSVTLLLLMNGADNSQSITDSASSPNTITAVGNAKLSAGDSKFGGTSAYFDGTGDYFSAPSSSNFAFGTGDFTIEFWLKTTDSSCAILDNYTSGTNGSWQVFISTSGTLQFWKSASAVKTSIAIVNDGAWHHVAIVRASGGVAFYIDGTVDGATVSVTDNFNYLANPFAVGAQVATRNAAYDYLGYLDDIRITKGVARYTANFIPPTTQLATSSAPGQSGDSLFSSVQILYFADAYAKPKALTRYDTVTYSQFAPSWPFTYKKIDADPIVLRRVDYGGFGRVYGTVKIKGAPDVPVARRVRLIRDLDGVCVSEVWSDPVTGAYEFRGFDPLQRYTVLAYDYQQNFRAVIADNLTPEAYL